METNKLNRLLLWATIILFVTNLSMAISFLYQRAGNKEQTLEQEADKIANELRARTFREQLNLKPEQMDSFREFTRKYNRNANAILQKLERLRIDMVTELGKENTDSVMLYSLTNEIGMLHTDLKNSTINYYRELNKICDPDQRVKLNAIFMSMVDKGEDVKLPPPGGWRHRYGRR